MFRIYRDLIHLRDSHPALRVGDWSLVESKPSRLLSYLRQNDDETFLVLINPSRKPIDDYSLTLTAGLLEEEIEVGMLLGEGEPSAPTINDSGGFFEYKPLSSLPPQSTFILELSS